MTDEAISAAKRSPRNDGREGRVNLRITLAINDDRSSREEFEREKGIDPASPRRLGFLFLTVGYSLLAFECDIA